MTTIPITHPPSKGLATARFHTTDAGVNTRQRTNFPTDNLGRIINNGIMEMVYAKSATAIPAGAVGVTVTAPTTTNVDGYTKVATEGNAVVAAGAGYTSDMPFAIGDYGWVYRPAP